MPIKLPSQPDGVYKNEWQGWFYFLNKRGGFVSFKEAKECVIKHRIKSGDEYRKRRKNIPLKLPGHPDDAYKENWQGWPHFLGKTDVNKI